MPPKSLLATHLDFRFFRHPCVLYHCTGRFIHDSSLSTTQMVLQCIYPCFHQIDPSVLKLPIQQLNGACICSNELISNLTSFHTLGILFTIYHQNKNYLLSFIVLTTFRFSLATPFLSWNLLNFYSQFFQESCAFQFLLDFSRSINQGGRLCPPPKSLLAPPPFQIL